MTDNRERIASTDGAWPRACPLVKWAGGKSRLLAVLDQHLPPAFNRYFEPFAGGAALFFHLHAKHPGLRAFLSDLNEELINCYIAVRDDVESVIRHLKRHRNDEDYFYSVRALDTAQLSDAERAARIIYLNKTCFNGLYRVNRQGKFNVPFGAYKNPRTCDEDNLRAVSGAFKQVQISCTDFNSAVKSARRGDFIYFDPPYQPLSATANFTSYTSRCFGAEDQRQLADLVRRLDRRGCYVMVSNSDNELISELYKNLNIHRVYATRAINCKADRRGKISELLITNY